MDSPLDSLSSGPARPGAAGVDGAGNRGPVRDRQHRPRGGEDAAALAGPAGGTGPAPKGQPSRAAVGASGNAPDHPTKASSPLVRGEAQPIPAPAVYATVVPEVLGLGDTTATQAAHSIDPAASAAVGGG
jgi:hypothetical protein